MRLDAGVRERDEPHRRLEAELLRRRLRRKQARRRAVRQSRRVAGSDAPARPEGRSQGGQALEGRIGPEELVLLGELPPVVAEDAHRDDGAGVDAVVVGPCVGRPSLRLHGVAIRILPRQVWEDVVEVLRGLAHHRGALVDQALGDEAGVEVDVLAHRVMTHVLDASGDREVARAHRDLSRSRGDGGQRAGAHPVDGEAGNRVRKAGEERRRHGRA